MLLTLLLLLTFPSFAFANVQNVCGLTKSSVTIVNNLEDLNQSLCALPGLDLDSKIKVLTTDTRAIIEKINAPDSKYKKNISLDPMDDKALVAKLRSISDILSNRLAPTQFRTEKNDSTSESMTALFKTYETEGARKNNPQAYYRALRDVLSKTTQGARVLECFYRAETKVKSSSVEFLKKGADTSGNAASFQTRYNELERNYSKVITLNPINDPALTLIYLGHELQHSCDTQGSIKLQDGYRGLEEKRDQLYKSHASNKKLEENADQIEGYTAITNLSDGIDELRAYRMMPELFSELAAYHPAFFCQQYGAGNLFGRQVISVGEYMSTLETKIKDGSFINTLIESYSASGGYDSTSFYQTDENLGDYKKDSHGNKILRPEVKSAITEAGFFLP